MVGERSCTITIRGAEELAEALRNVKFGPFVIHWRSFDEALDRITAELEGPPSKNLGRLR